MKEYVRCPAEEDDVYSVVLLEMMNVTESLMGDSRCARNGKLYSCVW